MSFLDELAQVAEEIKTRGPTDLTRLKTLPRRQYTQDELEHLVQHFTERLKVPTGGMTLRPVQALALHEVSKNPGLIGMMRVAAGKALTSLLIPMVVPCKKAVLLVPPDLKQKLIKYDYPRYLEHFSLPNLSGAYLLPGTRPTLFPVAYSELSSQKRADILDQIRPDLVICDEAHALTAPGYSARKARFKRYFKFNPQTRLYALSGTLIRKSMMDLAFLFKTALHDFSPLPHDYHTLLAWSVVLDPEDRRHETVEDWRTRQARKELSELFGGDIEKPRESFRRLLFQTPGIVMSEGKRECDAGFLFHERKIALPAEVRQTLDALRKKWVLGDEVFSDKIQLSRAARQLACGLYTRCTWPKNEPLPLREAWLRARGSYNSALRDFLQHRSKPGADSPLLVHNALARGDLPKEHELRQAWETWCEIEPKCAPEPETVWVSDYLIRDAAEWGKRHKGLIWYFHKDLGPKIAEAGNFELFADESDSERLLQAVAERRGPLVLSGNVFYKGQDLQTYHEQLLTSTSPNPVRWQQLLGRTAREGQESDYIHTWVYRHTPELITAWLDAKKGAHAHWELTKDEQLLLQGDETWVTSDSPTVG